MSHCCHISSLYHPLNNQCICDDDDDDDNDDDNDNDDVNKQEGIHN